MQSIKEDAILIIENDALHKGDYMTREKLARLTKKNFIHLGSIVSLAGINYVTLLKSDRRCKSTKLREVGRNFNKIKMEEEITFIYLG